MVKQEETICAIVTPQGVGGISVIRLSGKDAIAIASGLFRAKSGNLLTDVKTYTIHYGYIVDPVSGEKIDEVLVSVMKSPHSFTCEDVVEVSCHGSPFVTERILEAFLKVGAKPAEPGEFTKRAFLNGRIDLAQAEAVIDVIRARTEEGLRCALYQLEGNLSNEINVLYNDITDAVAYLEAYIDFPEEDAGIAVEDVTERVRSAIKGIDRLIEGYYRWRPYREGVLTAIVGRVNAGKSSLLNILVGEERAIVTPYPGTTRDIVDGLANIHGIPLRLLDTAGLRMAKDMAEEEGIKRMYRSIDAAELILLVFDGSTPLTAEDKEILTRSAGKKKIIVINKIDMGNLIEEDLDVRDRPVVLTSAIKGEGIGELKKAIFQTIASSETKWDGGAIVSNARHKVALEGAEKDLYDFLKAVKERLPLEIQALHLRSAADHLGEITGVVTTEDILNRIFSEFCIGK